MKKEEWNEGLNHLDSDLVEKYISQKDALTQKSKTPKVFWLRVGVIAACIALLIGVVVVLQNGGLGLPSISGPTDPTSPTRPPAPIWEGAIYSAEEMAQMFNQKLLGVATSHYTKVSVRKPEELQIKPIPDVEYLDVYRRIPVESELAIDKEAFRTFVDSYFPKMAESLGVYTPYYEIRESLGLYSDYLYTSATMNGHKVECRQLGLTTTFTLTNAFDEKRKAIRLNGKQVVINNNQSDEDMIASLENVKNTLFGIFGVSLPDAKIERGSWFTTVYFYDKSAEPFNFAIDALEGQTPVTDRIKISFSHMGTYITYTQMRGDFEGEFECFARAKMISLEEAEELLYKGYVFGGHSCPICMGQQTEVDFEGYDFVSMEYLFGYDSATVERTPLMPFYAFYKKIGTAENGNLIYAKTYVSAVEVSGYEDHFKS